MVNIKPWHVIAASILVVFCVFLLVQDPFSARSNHIDSHDFIRKQKTVPIRFKRRKDIPNQCFPLNEEVSGCLPSVVVLGPSTAEIDHIISILESHSGLNNGISPKAQYHTNPSKTTFYSYFQSFPYESGRDFIYYDISDSYLHHGGTPMNVRQVAPTTVFLVPLMDPVERVISQFYSQTKNLPERCYEIPVEAYLQEEINVITQCNIPINFPKVPWNVDSVFSECKLISKDCSQFNWDESRKSYTINSKGALISESMYYFHLNHWYSFFDKKQFYITSMKSLYRPSDDLWKFLGADPDLWLDELADFKVQLPYLDAIDEQTKSWLQKVLRPSVLELYKVAPHIKFDGM